MTRQIGLSKIMVVAILVIAGAASAYAQETSSFSLSPLLVELQGLPGDRLRFELFLANDSATHKAFDVSVHSVQALRDGRYGIVQGDNSSRSAASWITVTPDEVGVDPRRSRVVVGEVNIPRDARGGYYAAVTFDLQPDDRDAEARASAVIRYRVAAIIEITVGRNFTPRAYISDLTVTPASEAPQLANAFGPNALWFRASLTNEGPIHTVAHGTLSIRDAQGRLMRQVPLGQGRGAVLPDATLDFSSILPTGLPPGDYTMQAVLYYGGLRPAIASTEFQIDADELRRENFLASPSVHFHIEPAQRMISLPPGAVRTETVTLVNLDTEPIEISAEVQPLIHNNFGELDVAQMAEHAGSIPWIRLAGESVTLRPQERRNVRVIVQKPREAIDAAYAQVVFKAAKLEPDEEHLNVATAELGVNVAVLPTEAIAPQAEIVHMEIIPGRTPDTVAVAALIQNTGGIHFQAQGAMIFQRHVIPEGFIDAEFTGEGFFETLWETPLPSDALQLVLPNEQRLLTGETREPLEPGRYRVIARLVYGPGAETSYQQEFIIEDLTETSLAIEERA